VFQGNWDHRLADSGSWNIDVLVDLVEVFTIIVYPGRNASAVSNSARLDDLQ